ncbi:hypothetical protein PHK61_20815 [Actinomycetospora lutea]|uniref:GH39 family glycosyl hydrolase n=1 Tax=Actinomycetospora lutea TaxID=663604 RepID=UPI002366E552|nr:hypothetical protein [Actinomycetospora lutea]MDD7940869.1 hypothetical protein [Actinomycetospora lutea]
MRSQGVRGPRVLAALSAAAALLLAAGCESGSARASAAPSNVLGPGLTHTQFSAIDAGPQAAGQVAVALAAQPMPQAQHIMGFGVANPEPSPGEYDFAGLDARMDFIRRSGGTPVITLCCAPDWMKGGAEGTTDWRRLEVAPEPEHYQDFADLAAEISRRYPDVHHFQVWNEFKGFFNEETKTWDGPAYTDLYNRVYDALKEVDPGNQVGGPYIEMGAPPPGVYTGPSELTGPWGLVDQRVLDAFDYWNDNKRGADFVVVDGHTTTEEGAPDDATALAKIGDVNRWIQGRTSLPLWWAEWYVEPDAARWPPEKRLAQRAAGLVEFARTGVATSFYWNAARNAASPSGLWRPDGTPEPFLGTLQEFARQFPPGAPVTDVGVAPPVFGARGPRATVLVNTSDAPVTATVEGADVELGPYEVRWIPRGV